jgi:hypothetical protein
LQQVLLRPTAAEAARTVMEVCVDGTLSTLSQDGWPLGTEVRFAVDVEGNPVLRLQPSALHTKNLLSDSRCSLHAQARLLLLLLLQHNNYAHRQASVVNLRCHSLQQSLF